MWSSLIGVSSPKNVLHKVDELISGPGDFSIMLPQFVLHKVDEPISGSGELLYLHQKLYALFLYKK